MEELYDITPEYGYKIIENKGNNKKGSATLSKLNILYRLEWNWKPLKNGYVLYLDAIVNGNKYYREMTYSIVSYSNMLDTIISY